MFGRFSRNYDEVSSFMNNAKFRPVILSETWFSEDTCSGIAGYTGYYVAYQCMWIAALNSCSTNIFT